MADKIKDAVDNPKQVVKENEAAKHGGATPNAEKKAVAQDYHPANEETKVPQKTEEETWEKDLKETVSIPMVGEEKESEHAFLTRLLGYQHEGGFGKHLDAMIYGRMKSLEPAKSKEKSTGKK